MKIFSANIFKHNWFMITSCWRVCTKYKAWKARIASRNRTYQVQSQILVYRGYNNKKWTSSSLDLGSHNAHNLDGCLFRLNLVCLLYSEDKWILNDPTFIKICWFSIGTLWYYVHIPIFDNNDCLLLLFRYLWHQLKALKFPYRTF